MSAPLISDAVLIEAVNALQQFGNKVQAARALGIPRQTLQSRIRLAKDRGMMRHEFDVEQLPIDDLPIDELIELRKREFRHKQIAEEARRLIHVKLRIDGPIGILNFGDPHVDDDGCDIEAVEHDTRLVRATPGLFGLNIGDSTNNWVGRLARLYGEQNTSAKRSWRLAEWFLNSVDWLTVIGGNHDGWSGAGDPLHWILTNCTGIYAPIEARLSLDFPCGESVTMNVRHNWPGNSQWNPAHGVMKAAQFGFDDDIVLCGHKHTTGYGIIKNPMSGKISHCLQIGSYKVYDRYQKELGLRDQQISPCAVTVINPQAKPLSRIHVFWDSQEGADYLNYLRRQK